MQSVRCFRQPAQSLTVRQLANPTFRKEDLGGMTRWKDWWALGLVKPFVQFMKQTSSSAHNYIVFRIPFFFFLCLKTLPQIINLRNVYQSSKPNPSSSSFLRPSNGPFSV